MAEINLSRQEVDDQEYRHVMMITLRILCILGLLGLGYGAIGGNKEKMDKMDPESKEYQTTGVLMMDSITFNKLVPNKNADMILMVAAKGNIGKRTTDYMREEFLQMAKKASKKDDGVLFAQILVNGSENKKQAERLGVEDLSVSDETKPEFFLVKRGEENAIPLKPDVDDFSVADIMAFVSKTTGVNFPSRGTIKELDAVVGEFMKSEGEGQRVLWQKAKQIVKEMPKEKKSQREKVANGEFYTNAMEKVLEKGPEWVDSELSRLRAIIVSDKVSDSRKDEFKRRVNIVQAFKEAPTMRVGGAEEPTGTGEPSPSLE